MIDRLAVDSPKRNCAACFWSKRIDTFVKKVGNREGIICLLGWLILTSRISSWIGRNTDADHSDLAGRLRGSSGAY